MAKNILAHVCIALFTLGIALIPGSAKAADLSEAISSNADFSIISCDTAPEALNEEINLYKGSEGFLYYIDSDSGDLYTAVMLGERPTPGYDVKINYIRNVEGTVSISADEISPDKNDILPQVITYPYAILKTKLTANKICVINSSGKVYNYLGSNEAIPILGVSWIIGSLQNVYTNNNYIFLEILDSNKVSRLFYVSNSDEWKNKIRNLNLNTAVSVRFALGTPEKYNEMYAFPMSEINAPVDKASLYDSTWEELDSYSNVPSDKKWTITFNEELDENSLISSNIYVTDKAGNIIPVILSLCEDKKSVELIPYKNYKLGEKYYLFITNDLNKSDISSKGRRMSFKIADCTEIK